MNIGQLLTGIPYDDPAGQGGMPSQAAGPGGMPLPSPMPMPAVPQASPAEVNPAAPKTPEELAHNKTLWQSFVTKLKDPNVRQALMVTGTGLMRSPGFGQNGWDVAGQALSAGAQTLYGLREKQHQEAIAAAERARKAGIEVRQISNEEKRTGIYGQQTDSQVKATDASIGHQAGQLGETVRHNKAEEEIARQRAEADKIRARAYSAAGEHTPADIQKINMLAAQLMAEGMDEIGAKARATQMVEFGAKEKSPGAQAQSLYMAKIKAWQDNLENFGKSLTKEQLKAFQDESINDVVKFQQVDKALRNEPIQETQRSGPINRNNNPNPAAGATPPTANPNESGPYKAGDVVKGYRFKGGNYRDKNNWEKVK